MIKKGYTKHIFICENTRDASNPKKSCGNAGSAAITAELKKQLVERKVSRSIRANKAGCLGMCEHGPSMVIYPQGIWYGGINMEDIGEIIDRSILKDEVIERLVIREETDSNPQEVSS